MQPRSAGAPMLRYCQMVLKAVRFDRRLFRKEYRKSLRMLNRLEAVELKRWLRGEALRTINS